MEPPSNASSALTLFILVTIIHCYYIVPTKLHRRDGPVTA